jgi:hypothetical protein
LISCQAIPWAVSSTTTPPQEVAWLSCPLAHALLGLPIFEAILLQVAQWDLYTFMPIGGDDRLFGDQFAQVLANRFLDTLVMPQTVLQPATA